jgi:DNA-binding MarR family transcriptional regulator
MVEIDRVDDARITTFGLLLESHAGLVRVFDQHLQYECGLPLRRFEVLLRLARSPGRCLPAGELSRSISLTTGATTRRIDRLVAAGLIERRTRTTDRRFVDICLTRQGELRLAEALPVHLADLDRHLVAILSADELSNLDAALRHLRDQFLDSSTTDIAHP